MKFSVKFADEKQLLKFHEICRDGRCVSFHMKFHTALTGAPRADVSTILHSQSAKDPDGAWRSGGGVAGGVSASG